MDAAAARAFRNALQAKGVLALNLTLDRDLTRGFSLHHLNAPLVAANTRDPHPARLFSYAHELVHLCLGRDAVCGTQGSHPGVERFCNQVAAAVLMPREDLVAYKEKRFGDSLITDVKRVTTIKNHFHVSMRAAAIRLENLGLGIKGLFRTVDQTVTVDQKGRGFPSPNSEARTRPIIRVEQYGHEFVGALFAAQEKGILRPRQISELLSVSEKELGQVKYLAVIGSDS